MKIGNFEIIKSLGKGGMGEVFLAYDSLCARPVALKKIREDLVQHKSLHKRFLKEAQIAAKLTHPYIISIFSIHQEENSIYYTMPYIEGQTLKQIVIALKEGDASFSSTNYVRILLNVCQAIAYCHSKGVLHRDLKLENIIVGKFGEVLILDWGLAEELENREPETQDNFPEQKGLTRPGKIVGTLAYLAPERGLGLPASFQTDIFAIGIILYQLLTFKLPFKRKDIETFQKTVLQEELVDPIEAAPYRDIPHHLSSIIKKALQPHPKDRYKNILEMILDLESYLEGNPEWMIVENLSLGNKKNWEFQENIFIAKHTAITKSIEMMEWVTLMISKKSFMGNTRIEATLSIEESCTGIGFLLNVPEGKERNQLFEGYCFWLGSQAHPGLHLSFSNIEIMYFPTPFLEPGKSHKIILEKTENHLKFFLDGTLACDYKSQAPLTGSHIGILYKDANFDLSHFSVSLGSQNVTVNCLALPDAFLSQKNFSQALEQYRQIALSFPGRIEGREAIFRAGITLIKEASTLKSKRKKNQALSLSLQEFGKLHLTAGAPLEYLGKSLVYKAMNEIEEEVKCLELAIRKYSKHPLLPRMIEHIVFRLNEAASSCRKAAYHLTLLTLRHLPFIFDNPDHKKLLSHLKKNLEPLFFLEKDEIEVHLAFLLAKPITLLELLENDYNPEDILFSLLELGQFKILKQLPQAKQSQEIKHVFKKKVSSLRVLRHLTLQAIDENKGKEILPLIPETEEELRIRTLLSLGHLQEAREILEKYPPETLCDETSPLYPLFGIYLWVKEGKKIALAHFSGILEIPFPKTSALLGYFLTGKINLKKGWINNAFFFEKEALLRDLILLSRCLKKTKLAFSHLRYLKRIRQDVRRQ